jgi:hypothetical protein
MELVDRPEVVFRDDACLVSRWRSLAITVVGSGALSVAGVEGQVDACEALGRAVGRGRLVEVVLLDAGIALPSAQVRRALEDGAKRLGPWYAGVGTVFESPGFRAIVIRGLFRSLQLASPVEFEQRVFASTRACVEWVLPISRGAHLPAFAPRELVEAISCARGEGQMAGLMHTPRAMGNR